MKKNRYIVTVSLLCFATAVVCWFARPATHLSEIPLTRTGSNVPALEVEVSGNKYLVKLDTGSKFFLSLDEHILHSIIDKKTEEIAKWRDVKGNFYESPAYLVPKICLGNLFMKNVVVKQEDPKNKENCIIWDNPNDTNNRNVTVSGIIGRPLLEKTNLLLDLGHDRMIVTNSIEALRSVGIPVDSMEKLPLDASTKGLILTVDTDAGPLRLDIDTGATLSFVRASKLKDRESQEDHRGLSFFSTTKFIIGTKNFGETRLFLLDITPELTNFDGFIGVDFLKDHLLYIDYPNKVAYIG